MWPVPVPSVQWLMAPHSWWSGSYIACHLLSLAAPCVHETPHESLSWRIRNPAERSIGDKKREKKKDSMVAQASQQRDDLQAAKLLKIPQLGDGPSPEC